MPLVSMKLTKREKKPEAVGRPQAYPWGLGITLDEHALQKLGIDNLPEPGSNMTLEARVRVERTSSTEDKAGKKFRSVSLQITSLALVKGRATLPSVRRVKRAGA